MPNQRVSPQRQRQVHGGQQIALKMNFMKTSHSGIFRGAEVLSETEKRGGEGKIRRV
jgi:hypothetical protein